MDGIHPPGPAARGLAWATALYLCLPILIILPVALTDQRFLSLPQEGISLQHFRTVLTSPEWLGSIWQSFTIAVAATVLSVVAGTLCAIGCWRISRRATELVRVLMLLPLIIPSIVYAIGLYRYFGPLGLLDRFMGVVIAHGVTGIPYVVITVSTALAAFDPDELVMVLFIASRDVFTLPRRIWDGINENLDPAMAAVAVLLILFTTLLLMADRALRRRSEGG